MVVLRIGRDCGLEAAADRDAKSICRTKLPSVRPGVMMVFFFPSSEPPHGAWVPVSVRNYSQTILSIPTRLTIIGLYGGTQKPLAGGLATVLLRWLHRSGPPDHLSMRRIAGCR
jgi:hypothetical protein